MLSWTGERFIPGVKGDIEVEHLHRYHAAAELVGGLRVLDIACGEGYGSSILAQRAASVVGIDISADAVAHAQAHYVRENLRFAVGSCVQIPIDDASVDAIVSFETIEHVAEQEDTLREFARVLRPGGWLCISCPDRLEYSDLPHFSNQYHVRELYANEFRDLLQRHFTQVTMYGQRLNHGSVLGPVGRSPSQFFSYRQDKSGPVRTVGISRPVYLLAVASNGSCPELPAGSFEPEEPIYFSELRALQQQLVEARAVVGSEAACVAGSGRAALETTLATLYVGGPDDEIRFSEQRAVHVTYPLNGEVTRLTFGLAGLAGVPVRRLRFDPANRICQLDLARVAIISGQETAWEWRAENSSRYPWADAAGMLPRRLEQGPVRIICTGEDPQCLLDLPAEALERLSTQAAVVIELSGALISGTAIAGLADLAYVVGNELSESRRQIEGIVERLQSAGERQSPQAASLIAERDGLQQQLRAREADLTVFGARCMQTESQLRAQELERQHWEQRARHLLETVAAIQSSRSWRWTAPLRAGGAVARAASIHLAPRSVASKVARFTYRHAPLSKPTRRRMKEWAFARFPKLFAQTIAYRQWSAFRAESRALANLRFEMPGALASPNSLLVPPHANAEATDDAMVRAHANGKPVLGGEAANVLKDADGSWEWTAYAQVKERVMRAELARHDEQRIEPIDILDLSENQLDVAIAGLEFPATQSPVVSILVPTYGNLKYTVECLMSILASAPGVDYEVIVADDASADGTAQRLSGIANLRVLPNAQNLGFLRNVNRALDSVRGRYVLLLNNDVQVRPGWLDVLVETAASERDVGAVGPKIVYPSGHLQEAGCSFRPDCTSDMVGLNASPDLPQFNFMREVDYCSGACLLLNAAALRDLSGFDEDFAPAYCEDSDLCLRMRQRGLRVLYNPKAIVVHHLSKTTAAQDNEAKFALVGRNLDRFAKKWQETIAALTDVRLIAFYLPQFHPIPENDRWWGKGFTEWRNVVKARPNFVGHYQPRVPMDLGYYDLRVPSVLEQQIALARRYGVGGFCFYYYWFAGQRLLEMPLERMLQPDGPDFPFCVCWANENWTRRWDGQDQEILMAQAHSDADDAAVIHDLMRYMRRPNYIRINGKPLLVVYRVTLFPDFARTAQIWRDLCCKEGIGEIFIAMVESFEMVFTQTDPARYGCDAAVEFPPQGMAEPREPSGSLINPNFSGHVADYRELAVRYCLREQPPYTRFRGLMTGWDNTARRQDNSFCFENATPGAFQAWAEHAIEQTRVQRSGDERIVFINAWNEWAEGAYLEPDRRFGHAFLEAVSNARDSAVLKRRARYALN
jgi:GT2 family glycosyltransferase/SAM-dependent methyltransferase